MNNVIITLMFSIAVLAHSTCSLSAQDSTATPGRLFEEVKASAFVDRKEVPLNRMLLLTIKVEWQGDLNRYEIEEFETPVVSNFEIMGSASSNRVGEANGRTQAVKVYEFTLRPSILGMGYIDGVIIKYRDTLSDESRRLVTNRLEVKVIDPVPEPGESRIPWPIFLGLLLGGAGVASLLWIISKKREERRQREELAKVVPVEENYLKDLRDAVDIASPDLNLRETTSTLSRLYRKYLADKYGIRALEATTDEVIARLNEAHPDTRMVSETEEILKKCDIAKFSGGSGDFAEVQRIYTLIEGILQRNSHVQNEPGT